jgi:hypothetical protein|tara:strand:+ start:52 stop:702 length:651 start_codon:yes stop_codon:yes gene_type:complete
MTYDVTKDKLIHSFSGQTKISKNYSQAYQDLFVLSMLDGKTNGRYVEIGGYDAKIFSNTFILESIFNWKGFSIEIDKTRCGNFNNDRDRQNRCYLADATKFDYIGAMLTEKWKDRIDYLSVDCEPSYNTLKSLLQFPLDRYRCSVITFEHDFYADGSDILNKSREYLTDKGYQLVCSNVCNVANPFEDWWIDPQVVSEEIWKPFVCSNMEARSIFL